MKRAHVWMCACWFNSDTEPLSALAASRRLLFLTQNCFALSNAEIWLSSKTQQTFLFKSFKTKRRRELWQVVKRTVEERVTVADSRPERRRYQAKSFVVTRRPELPDTVSSELRFKLSVEPCGFSVEARWIINTAHRLKAVIWCFDHILHLEVNNCWHAWVIFSTVLTKTLKKHVDLYKSEEVL